MKSQKNNTEILADRSPEADPLQNPDPRRSNPLAPPLSSTPGIFPGDMSQGSSPLLGPSGNRPITRRKVSPFNIMLMLIGGAIAIVLYVGNIIVVNELLAEINQLQAEHQRLVMDQEILRAQLNKMASLERIQEIAERDLGLKSLREPPEWLTVDQERIKEIEESLDGQKPK